MADRFKERVAIVTGGGSGIGQATSIAFAHEGAKVVVADIDPVGGEKTIATIKKAGGDWKVVRAGPPSIPDDPLIRKASIPGKMKETIFEVDDHGIFQKLLL